MKGVLPGRFNNFFRNQTPMAIKTLVFDFGNVLAHFDYLCACGRIGEPMGLTGAEVLSRLRSSGFVELLQEYESGKIQGGRVHESVCSILGSTLEFGEFANIWNDIFTLNEPVAELLPGLAGAGYRLILGSNTNEMHATYYRQRFSQALSPFVGFVLSYEIGCQKPSAEFYHACIAQADAAASECVFIDDMLENVEGARAVGMNAVCFRERTTLVAELSELGVRV